MPAADPNIFPYQGTITSDAYAASDSPDCVSRFNAGTLSVANPDAARTVYGSFDGINDSFLVPPGCAWSPPERATGWPVARIWFRLDEAGSVVVSANVVNGLAVTR